VDIAKVGGGGDKARAVVIGGGGGGIRCEESEVDKHIPDNSHWQPSSSPPRVSWSCAEQQHLNVSDECFGLDA